MHEFNFRKKYPLEARKAEAERMISKYPDRIPIIVEKYKDSELAELDKKKFLVPHDLTVGQFLYVLRKKINIAPECAIYIFTKNGIMPPTGQYIKKLDCSSDDGFIYIFYSSEKTFG